MCKSRDKKEETPLQKPAYPKIFNFNFNFILPKVNTDYIRQAQVLNIDKLR